jgi:hypothetical protein
VYISKNAWVQKKRRALATPWVMVPIRPVANPTMVSYNANVVKIYNTTLILLRFEENNILH